MRRALALRLTAAASALAAGALFTIPANAAPVYPMLFATITANPNAAVDHTVDAQFPTGWVCDRDLGWPAITGTSSTYILRCKAPTPQPGLENTCVWNVVKLLSTTGAPSGGNLYGQSHCDEDPGATASTGTPGSAIGYGRPNLVFTYAYCRASVSTATDALARPWSVRCSTNH